MINSLISSNPDFDQPQWNATLWRYMSVDKFFDLLFSNSLYLTNIRKMTDKNETKIPEKNKKSLKQRFISDTNDKAIGEKAYANFIEDLEARKNSSFVNCWIMDPSENYALWKLYLSGEKLGLAVKTKTKSLLDSINNVPQEFKDNLFFSKINYTDYIKGEINFEKLIVSKRNPYKYENESRLILLKKPEFDDNKQIILEGVKLNVDTEILVEEIYISPFGGKIFDKNIRKLIDSVKPEFQDRIRLSIINDT